MNIWTTIKTWVLSWFVSAKEYKVIEILEGLNDFFNKALPIVQQIDEELKPSLKKLTAEGGDSVDTYETILAFLSKFKEYIGDIAEVAQRVYLLPLPDMLFTIAIEILKSQSTSNPSLSMLRLAVELAYNVYKRTKKS